MEFKNVLVAGTGKSGISAAKLLLKHGVNVYLFDENENRKKKRISSGSWIIQKKLSLFSELLQKKYCRLQISWLLVRAYR